MTYPHVVAYRHRLRAAPIEKLRLVLFAIEIGGSAVGEVALRDPPHRMIAGIDADTGGNRAKFADPGVDDVAVVDDVAIVAKLRFDQRCARANLRVAPEPRLLHLGRPINEWFRTKPFHRRPQAKRSRTGERRWFDGIGRPSTLRHTQCSIEMRALSHLLK